MAVIIRGNAEARAGTGHAIKSVGAVHSLRRPRGRATAGVGGFGYDVEHRNYVPKEVEQAVIARIVRLRATGALLESIADTLNVEGLATKLGHSWRRWGVRRVLDQNEPDGVRLQPGCFRFHGGIPRYGFTLERHERVPLASEQAVIEQIMSMRRTGMLMQAIADALNNDGLRAKQGGAWSRAGVSRVLRQVGLP